MRILVLNEAVTGVQEEPPERWYRMNVSYDGDHLYAPATAPDLVDYDVFIVDTETISFASVGAGQKRIDDQLTDRVRAGGCLICFCGSRRPAWLPEAPEWVDRSGTRVAIESHGLPERMALSDLVRHFEGQIHYRVSFRIPPNWVVLARARDQLPVALARFVDPGLFLLLPDFRNRGQVALERIGRVRSTLLISSS